MGLIAWPVRHPRHWRPVHLLGSQLFSTRHLSFIGRGKCSILDLPVSSTGLQNDAAPQAAQRR
jgi:hypothetical protein